MCHAMSSDQYMISSVHYNMTNYVSLMTVMAAVPASACYRTTGCVMF